MSNPVKNAVLDAIDNNGEWNELKDHVTQIRRALRTYASVDQFQDEQRLRRDFAFLGNDRLASFLQLVQLQLQLQLQQEVEQLLQEDSRADTYLRGFVAKYNTRLTLEAQRWLLDPLREVKHFLKVEGSTPGYVVNNVYLDDEPSLGPLDKSVIRDYLVEYVNDEGYFEEERKRKRKKKNPDEEDNDVKMKDKPTIEKFESPLKKNIGEIYSLPQSLGENDRVQNIGESLPLYGRVDLKKKLLRRIFSMKNYKIDSTNRVSSLNKQDQNGGFTCVVGSSGIGKTSLLRKGIFSLREVLNDNKTEFGKSFQEQAVGTLLEILGDKKKCIFLYMNQFSNSFKSEKSDPEKNFKKRCLFFFYRTYCEYNGSLENFMTHAGVDEKVRSPDFEIIQYIRNKMEIDPTTEIIIIITLDDVQDLVEEYRDAGSEREKVRKNSYFHSINEFLFKLTMIDEKTCVLPVYISTNTLGVEELKVSSGHHYEFLNVNLLSMNVVFKIFAWLYNSKNRDRNVIVESLESSTVLKEFLNVYTTNPGYIEFFCNIASQFSNGEVFEKNEFSVPGWRKFINERHFDDKKQLLEINKHLESKWFDFRFCQRSLWDGFVKVLGKEKRFVFDFITAVLFEKSVKRDDSFGNGEYKANDLESGGVVCLQTTNASNKFIMKVNCNVLAHLLVSLSRTSVVFDFPLLKSDLLTMEDREKEIQDVLIMCLKEYEKNYLSMLTNDIDIKFRCSTNHIFVEDVLSEKIGNCEFLLTVNGKAAPSSDSYCRFKYRMFVHFLRCIQSKRLRKSLHQSKKFNIKLEFEKAITEKSKNRVLYEQLIQNVLKETVNWNKVRQYQQKFEEKVKEFLEKMESSGVNFEFVFIADCASVEEMGYKWKDFEKGDYEKRNIRLILNGDNENDFETLKEYYGNYLYSLLFLKSDW